MVLKFEHFADFGTGEPFVARIVGLSDLINITNFKNKKEVSDSILTIFMEGLSPAFLSLKEIRAIEKGEKQKILLNLTKNYYNLFDHLWIAYKDRTQKASKIMGVDM